MKGCNKSIRDRIYDKDSRKQSNRKKDTLLDNKLRRRTTEQGKYPWIQSKRSVLRFLVLFGALIILIHAVIIPLYNTHVLPPLLPLWAEVSAGILKVFGYDAWAEEEIIVSSRFALKLYSGCSIMPILAMLISAILAFPTSLHNKFPAIVVAILFLPVMNLIRIISIYCVGIYFRNAFELVHRNVWPALFTSTTILFWLIWAGRMRTARDM